MPERPVVIALDVNETLSDLHPLAVRLVEVDAPAHLLGTWFASTLRDGFALTAAGAYADFATVASSTLSTLLAGMETACDDAQDAARHVLDGITELPLHSDVPPGLERLRDAGIRLITLTNGSASTSQRLLERAGAAALVEEHLSVEAVGRWKPAHEPYHYAVQRCGVQPHELMLAAVHPWDIDGAKRAGLAACWIDRAAGHYPEAFTAPDLICRDFVALARVLTD